MLKRFLKLPVLGLLTLISFVFCWSWTTSGFAQSSDPNWIQRVVGQGSVFRASRAELALSPDDTIPQTDWRAAPLPQISLIDQAVPNKQGLIRAWAKVKFDRAILGEGVAGVMTENNRETVAIFLNGTMIFTNRRDLKRNILGWNRTYAVLMPEALLHEGVNEIIVQASSQKGFNLGIGTIEVGNFAVLSSYAQSQYLWRIAGPVAANVAMLVLAIAALMMWFARREEEAILWLVLTAVFWFVRNYHFFALEVPFDLALFRDISYYSVYFAISASLSFCVVFLNLPRARWIIIGMFAAGIGLSLGRAVAIQIFKNDGLVSVVALGIVVLVLALMIQDARKRPTLDHISLISVVCLIIGLSLHDIGRISNLHWWDGLGFHAQPYLGFFLFLVFSVSVGRRFVGALTLVEGLNSNLEVRVEEVRADLARSEAARRELEVLSAVDSERERLMREMHDGIGSNLITALAIAQNQGESPNTIATLKRAISDLKITVDSLAPVEGDLVALLANFRHRIEPDLRLAGIKCEWRVEECPPLPWLDAVNALQMLRIIQEAIGNVLTHAKAGVLEIQCYPMAYLGVDGVATAIKDDGAGFDVHTATQLGRGLSNIAARAQTLGGNSVITSQAEHGTNIWIWLPIVRQ